MLFTLEEIDAKQKKERNYLRKVLSRFNTMNANIQQGHRLYWLFLVLRDYLIVTDEKLEALTDENHALKAQIKKMVSHILPCIFSLCFSPNGINTCFLFVKQTQKQEEGKAADGGKEDASDEVAEIRYAPGYWAGSPLDKCIAQYNYPNNDYYVSKSGEDDSSSEDKFM